MCGGTGIVTMGFTFSRYVYMYIVYPLFGVHAYTHKEHTLNTHTP